MDATASFHLCEDINYDTGEVFSGTSIHFLLSCLSISLLSVLHITDFLKSAGLCLVAKSEALQCGPEVLAPWWVSVGDHCAGSRLLCEDAPSLCRDIIFPLDQSVCAERNWSVSCPGWWDGMGKYTSHLWELCGEGGPGKGASHHLTCSRSCLPSGSGSPSPEPNPASCVAMVGSGA